MCLRVPGRIPLEVHRMECTAHDPQYRASPQRRGTPFTCRRSPRHAIATPSPCRRYKYAISTPSLRHLCVLISTFQQFGTRPRDPLNPIRKPHSPPFALYPSLITIWLLVQVFYIFITSVLFGSLTDGAMQLRESLTLFIVYVTYILAVAAPVIHKKLQGRATGRETTLAGREAAMAKLKAHDTALLTDDGMGETERGSGDEEAGQGESKGAEREVWEGRTRQARAVSDEGEGGAWVGGNGEGNGGNKRDGSTYSPLQLEAVGAKGGGGSGLDTGDEAADGGQRGVHSPDAGAGERGGVGGSFGDSTQDGNIQSKDPAAVSYAFSPPYSSTFHPNHQPCPLVSGLTRVGYAPRKSQQSCTLVPSVKSHRHCWCDYPVHRAAGGVRGDHHRAYALGTSADDSLPTPY
jgi:hypothetical protein